MSEVPVSITAARSHMGRLWNALLKIKMPNTWVPVPIKRTLAEAIVVSIHALLKTPMARRIRPKLVYETLELVVRDEDEYREYEPQPGERIDEWFARMVMRREDETASEWIDRVGKIAMAVMPYIVTMRFTEEMLVGEESFVEEMGLNRL